MNKGILGTIAVVGAVVLAACAGTASSTAEFGKADGDEIRALVRDFVTAYNEKNVAKMGTFFAANASIMPTNRNTLRGLDAVKAYLQGRVTDEGATNLAIEPIAIEGQGNLAYVAANFNMDFQQPGAAAPRHDRGKLIWIVRKLGGHWKFEWHIINSDLPPPVSAAAN